MSLESPPADVPAPELPKPAKSAPPGVVALFLAFAKMSLAGFGGVLAFARRGIVEEHKWMTADEFNETFALCHFLPGPNIVNLSVVFGSRFAGVAGAIAAFAGLIGPPMLLVMVLAVLYAHFGQLEVLRRILAGISCGAVGLLIAVVVKMLMPLLKRRDIFGLVMMIAVFVAIGLARLPLQVVLLVAVPISIGVTFILMRRVSA
ncbi:MAG TPA: chromate transporter [Bradyrhizobium sp.]|uniref:chromate transporter n=1 Tax=Bradyrhizobium sp. TaxID=376 RepID=UPI002B67DE96|nr:chromate transporter [Bradyrhizobium sp.]HLZ03808.1 chromate transporter [Bradyrhizobium sp.]